MENKFTDSEIMKALECCIGDENGKDCVGCPLYEIDECLESLNRETLDIINRLKAQNQEFDVKIVIQMGTIDWQAKEINRQKAEIERLQKTIVDMNANLSEAVNCFTRMETLYKIKCKELEVAKSEARKEFAERLKEKLKWQLAHSIRFAVTRTIDNLVKEMEERE